MLFILHQINITMIWSSLKRLSFSEIKAFSAIRSIREVWDVECFMKRLAKKCTKCSVKGVPLSPASGRLLRWDCFVLILPQLLEAVPTRECCVCVGWVVFWQTADWWGKLAAALAMPTLEHPACAFSQQDEKEGKKIVNKRQRLHRWQTTHLGRHLIKFGSDSTAKELSDERK